MTQYIHEAQVTSDRLIRWPELHQRIGLSRSQIYNLVAKGQFPSPIKLGDRASGWLESEVSTWLATRVQESRVGKLRR